jgi:hypothetical protein
MWGYATPPAFPLDMASIARMGGASKGWTYFRFRHRDIGRRGVSSDGVTVLKDVSCVAFPLSVRIVAARCLFARNPWRSLLAFSLAS